MGLDGGRWGNWRERFQGMWPTREERLPPKQARASMSSRFDPGSRAWRRGHCKMSLPGSRPPEEDGIVSLLDELAAVQLAHERLVDFAADNVEAVQAPAPLPEFSSMART